LILGEINPACEFVTLENQELFFILFNRTPHPMGMVLA
jgi:hypothetical protein